MNTLIRTVSQLTAWVIILTGLVVVLGIWNLLQATDISSMKKHIACLEVGASYQRADDVETCETIVELGP